MVGLKCYCYSYNAHAHTVLTGHEEWVKCWNLQGDLVKNIEAGFNYKVNKMIQITDTVNPIGNIIC